MLPLLIDEGLPGRVAEALRVLGLDVRAVGDPDAPPKGSPDSDNCAWCAANGAVLVTNDRGKKDRTIFESLASMRVHALFVHNDLRSKPPHHLARALLDAEQTITDRAARPKGLIRHRLGARGRLESR